MSLTRVQEDRELRIEADKFQDAWSIEKEELTREVLTNPGNDWVEESLRIESQIEETMLQIAPLVMQAAANPVISRPTKAQAARGKKIRKQYNIAILMEMRRQLILDLISEPVVC